MITVFSRLRGMFFVSRRDAEFRRVAERLRNNLCVSASSAPLRETFSVPRARAML
jgi:hypothetical protein